MFEVSQLRKSFGSLPVLKDVSLNAYQGEVTAIIGPSGSGKTTLLRCAAMLENADDGTLELGGIAVVKDGVYSSKSILKQARMKCGMVFQNYNLFPHMSVLDNIADAPVNVMKIPREQAKKEALELLRKLGLADHANAYPFELSGGQQQRVAIARALALKPEVLFFDEPTSALDPELTNDVLKVIRTLANEGKCVIVVTHEMDFAEKVADRIVFMAEGVVVEEGRAGEVINNPASERTKAFIAGLKKEN